MSDSTQNTLKMNDAGLLVARIALGLAMAGHGVQKLFGWFGGFGLEGTAEFFETLGFNPGTLFAVAAGGSELVGGVLQYQEEFNDQGLQAYSEGYQQAQFGRTAHELFSRLNRLPVCSDVSVCNKHDATHQCHEQGPTGQQRINFCFYFHSKPLSHKLNGLRAYRLKMLVFHEF